MVVMAARTNMPSSIQLTVQGASPGGRFRLHDAVGRVLLDARIIGELQTLDVTGFAPGAYVCEIEGKRSTVLME